MRAALGSYDHPSRQRKEALFRALLRQLRPEIDWGPPAAPDDRPGAVYHRWIELIMAGVRLMECPASGSGKSAEIGLLAAAQGRDGSWEQNVLATVVILMALSGCGAAPEAVRCGVRFLLSQVREDGGLPFIRDEDIWVTALASLTLVESSAGGHQLRASENYLLAQQLACGGWGYTAGVSQPDADDTAVVLSFLTRQRSPQAARAARMARDWLLNLQNDDGGFPAFIRGAPSEVEITAKCIRALLGWATCPDTAAAARRAWGWLAAQQRPDGGFRHEWCLSPTFAVWHVMAAASAVRPVVGPAAADTVACRAAGFLANTATADGWRLRPDDQDSHTLTTAYATAGLAHAGQDSGSLLARGVRVLLGSALDAGVAPDSLGPRPFVYDVPLLYPIYRFGALAAARARIAARDWSRQ